MLGILGTTYKVLEIAEVIVIRLAVTVGTSIYLYHSIISQIK